MSEKFDFKKIGESLGQNIALPEDIKVKVVLERKLFEYKERIKEMDERIKELKSAGKISDADAEEIEKREHIKEDSRYKIFVLEKLFADGIINVNDVWIELQDKIGVDDFDPDLMINACEVISHYVIKGHTREADESKRRKSEEE